MKSVKVIVVALIATFFAATAAAQTQTFDDAVAKYKEGMTKIQEKDLRGALPILKEAMNIGIDLGDQGFEIVKEIQGLLPRINAQIGMELAKEKNYEEALAAFTEAGELADLFGDQQVVRMAARYSSNIYMAIGVESFNNKEYEKALEVFKKGYDQDQQNIKLALYTAKSYGGLKDYENASAIYKNIIETGNSNSKYEAEAKEATDDVTNLFLVGISEASMEKNLEKTIELTDKFQEVIPSEPISLLAVIQLANNNRQFNVVIARGDAAAQAQTDAAKKSEAYFLLGVAHQTSGNNDKAVAAYRQVTSGPNAPTAKKMVTELSK